MKSYGFRMGKSLYVDLLVYKTRWEIGCKLEKTEDSWVILHLWLGFVAFEVAYSLFRLFSKKRLEEE